MPQKERQYVDALAQHPQLHAFVVWSAGLGVLDQLLKGIVAFLQPGTSLGLCTLTITYNEGAAFSMGQGLQIIYVLLYLVIVIGAGYYVYKHHVSPPLLTSLILLCGGGLGNTIDRVFDGKVIDYINLNFIQFPTFNVADTCITVGCILFISSLFWHMFKHSEEAR